MYKIYYSKQSLNAPVLTITAKTKEEALEKAENFRRYGYIADVYNVNDESTKKIG